MILIKILTSKLKQNSLSIHTVAKISKAICLGVRTGRGGGG